MTSPSQDPNPNLKSEQTPAERDAERVSKHHPISFVLKVLLFVLVSFVVVCVILYMMAGTPRGTQFFIDKVINETGVTLEYGEGNLRDGLLVHSATLSASEDIDVKLIDAYVKIGWRALFMRQVHLRDATIKRIEVVNRQPPTGEPFDYKTLELPVDLLFDSARIDHIVYNQVGKDPIVVTEVRATDLSWVDTKVSVTKGNLQYADVVHVADLSGYIELQDDYPLDIDAVVTVQALEKVYIDPLTVQANGSLKRTTGQVQSLYNQSEIQGSFVAQGMDENAPFSAKLWWDDVTLPYAEGQHIRLKNGLATASGVTSDIELRLKADLFAKDIPSGHYQARATIANNQMQIGRLTAKTNDGTLLADGVLDWQDDFVANAVVQSRDYEVRQLLPEVAQPYAPAELDGKLAVKFLAKNADGLMQINAHLKQRDGEQIVAKVVQGKTPVNPRNDAPWMVGARWQNLVRRDVPSIGSIDSPSGTASVTVRDNRLWVDADAQIDELNVAPKGRYRVKLAKVNDRISLNRIDYAGVMGDLSGDGTIVLANDSKDRPLTWQIDAKTNELLPQAFKAELPVERLQGSLSAQGVMHSLEQQIGDKTVSSQRHEVAIRDADLIARLTSQVEVSKEGGASPRLEARQVHIDGSGDADVTLLDGQLQTFDARFDGAVDTQGLPTGSWLVDASGDMTGNTQDIRIKTLEHQGEAGGLTAQGDLSLGDRIKWNVTAKAQAFDVGFFAPQTDAIVSGDLNTSGSWLTGKTDKAREVSKTTNKAGVQRINDRASKQTSGRLENFAVKFDGSVDTPKLPKGTLTVDASGDASVINIKTLKHQGEAGGLTAQGKVDVRQGVAWNIKAEMNNFNVGYFVKEAPSKITGQIHSLGSWQEAQQRIQISRMNLSGQLQGKPLTASGNLNVVMSLPKDMTAYTNLLKTADADGKASQVKQVVQTLNADNLKLQWADNYVVANGDANKLQAKVNIRNLKTLTDSFVEGLSGQLVGGMTLVQGNQALPTVFVDLQGKNINLPKVTLRAGSIVGKVVDLGKKPSQLSLKTDGLMVADREFKAVQLLFSGTSMAHVVGIKGKTTTDATAVGMTATLKGGLDLDAKRWQGVLGGGKIATDYVTLEQRQPAQLVASFGDNPSVTLASHCWLANKQSGRLCLRENLQASAKQGSFDVALQNIDTALLAPLLPKDLSWQAKLNGNAQVGWQQGKSPRINAVLFSDNGKIGMSQDADATSGQSASVQLGYKRISLIAKSVSSGLKLRADIDSGKGAVGYADVLVNPYKTDKPIDGEVVLKELDLAVFKPFFPAIRTLRGEVTLASKVDGTLTSPKLYGDFAIKDTAFALLDVPLNLTKINAKGKINGKSATIDGRFMSGEGKGNLSGTLDWRQDLQAKLSIQGNELVITQPPLLYAKVSPDLDVIVRPSQKYVNIEGVIVIPTATLRPPEANSEVATQSDDVVVLDRRLTGNLDEVLAVTEPWSINADIGVDLGDDVKFRGFGAVLPLAGAINISQKGKGVMQATGLVQVSRRSDIDVFGQSLELNYGQVRFAGDVLNPRLSIEASKEIEGQTVGVRVKGQVSEPNITVFNNAGLTQQQAMNALVTGRISNSGAAQTSEEGFKSEVSNTLAAAGLSYGLSGTRNLTNSIGQAFGLQRLTLDASGADNDANVNVTGYITPDLYIRYGVGLFNAQSTLSLRYQLTRRVYLEATSAAENAVDVVYSFQF